MINFLLKFSIGTFLILLIYDITNFIVDKTSTNSNPLLVVKRELSVPQKIEANSFEPIFNEFRQSPLWETALWIAASGGIFLSLALVLFCRRKIQQTKEVKKYLPARIRKHGEEEKTAHIVIIKEVGERIYSDKVVTLSDQTQLSTSRISEISSLYEDVLSQNLIDVLFVKSPNMDTRDLYPVKISTCPQKEDLTIDDPFEESNIQSSKTSLMEENIALDAGNEYNKNEKPVLLEKQKEQASVQCDGPERVSVKCGGSEQFFFEEVAPDPMSAGDTPGTMEKIEEKQKDLEERLTSIEDTSHEWLQRLIILEKSIDKWSQRLDLAESELVDLHQQMYTVLTKLEDKPKQNYIVLSALKKEATRLEQDAMKGIFDVETTLTKYISQDYVISENGRNYTKISQELVKPREDRKLLETYGESEIENVFHLKRRSIGLEAILEKEPEVKKKNTPKKTICKVPLHVLPPYKRSSFTATDSMADVRKTAQRFKRILDEKLR